MDRHEYENKCLAMVKESLKPKEIKMKILSNGELEIAATGFDFAEFNPQWKRAAQAQLNSDRKEVISELQGILDDNVSDQDKLNQVAHFIEGLKND